MELGPKATSLTPTLLLPIKAANPIKANGCVVVLAKGELLPLVLNILVAATMRRTSGVSQKDSWVRTGIPKIKHKEVKKLMELCCKWVTGLQEKLILELVLKLLRFQNGKNCCSWWLQGTVHSET